MRWARLNFGGENKRWHAVRVGHVLSICKLQHFDYPRVEYQNSQPGSGKLCKRCAKLAGAA